MRRRLKNMRRRVLHHNKEKTVDSMTNGHANGDLERHEDHKDDDDVEVPSMSVAMCISLLVAVTVVRFIRGGLIPKSF